VAMKCEIAKAFQGATAPGSTVRIPPPTCTNEADDKYDLPDGRVVSLCYGCATTYLGALGAKLHRDTRPS
jgi:hypothetical protein